jgi:hypothetical protein
VSDDEILQDVRTWLNQLGYVLEMEVARELLPCCSYVIQVEQYIDPVTAKLRETDIFCAWSDAEPKQDTYHSINMVIECKSTTAPWIAFFGGSADIWEGGFPYFMHDSGWIAVDAMT